MSAKHALDSPAGVPEGGRAKRAAAAGLGLQGTFSEEAAMRLAIAASRKDAPTPASAPAPAAR